MVNHIIALLKFHDYVIIPGFGGFISHYEPAKRSLSTQTITPPSKRLAFNKSLQENDGLLINQIVAADQISQSEAKAKIEAFRNEIELSLEQSDAYLFDGIGKLMLDVNRNLQFYPILQDNLLLDSFGLERVVAQPIQRIKEAFEQSETALDSVAEKAKVKEESKVISVQLEKEIYQPVVFRAAAAIGILFVISTVVLNLFSGKIDTTQFSFLPVVQQANETLTSLVGEEEMVNFSALNERDFVLFTPIEEEVETIATQEFTQTSITSNNIYNIIVGSFLNSTRMNREIANMKSKGYDVVTIAGPNGYTRVALQFDANTTSKQTQLQEVRNNINPDAWMMAN